MRLQKKTAHNTRRQAATDTYGSEVKEVLKTEQASILAAYKTYLAGLKELGATITPYDPTDPWS